MVWIHGGGFFSGSALQYGPAHLVKNNITVVTIQYRLGSIFRTQPAPKPEPRQSENPTSIVKTDCDTTNLPQQLQQSTQLPNDVNLIPQEKIQPSSMNETATTDTASYTQ